MDLLAGQAYRPGHRTVLEGIARALREGADLPSALSQHPRIFPAEYRALVAAGIGSGKLSDVLRISRRDYEVRARLGQRFRRTSIYLWFLLGLCALAFAEGVLLTRHYFELFGLVEEGGVVSWLLSGRFPGLKKVIWLTLGVGGTLSAGAIVARILFSRGVKKGTGYWIPAWGRILKSRDLGRWCTALALRTSAGAPLPDALESAGASVLNRKFRTTAEGTTRRVREGGALSDAMYPHKVFPPTLTWAVSLAESRGRLPSTFETYAELYQAEADRGFEALYLMMHPLGILMIGNIILLIAYGVLSPMSSFYF